MFFKNPRCIFCFFMWIVILILTWYWTNALMNFWGGIAAWRNFQNATTTESQNRKKKNFSHFISIVDRISSSFFMILRRRWSWFEHFYRYCYLSIFGYLAKVNRYLTENLYTFPLQQLYIVCKILPKICKMFWKNLCWFGIKRLISLHPAIYIDSNFQLLEVYDIKQDLTNKFLNVFVIRYSTKRWHFIKNFTFKIPMLILRFARQSRPFGNHTEGASPW